MIIFQAFCMPFRYYIFIPTCIVQRTLTLLYGYGTYSQQLRLWARNVFHRVQFLSMTDITI